MKEIIGFIGMILIQGSTVFQVLKFLKTKDASGVSVIFWWMVLFGLCFYMVYAIIIEDIVYMTSNAIGIMLTSISLRLYYRYRR